MSMLVFHDGLGRDPRKNLKVRFLRDRAFEFFADLPRSVFAADVVLLPVCKNELSNPHLFNPGGEVKLVDDAPLSPSGFPEEQCQQ